MILNLISTMLGSILIHEIGHQLYFRSIGKKVDLRFTGDGELLVGYPFDYNRLNNKQLFQLYYTGVAFGLVFIIIAGLFNKYAFILLPFYLYGSKSDLKNMWGIYYDRRTTRH